MKTTDHTMRYTFYLIVIGLIAFSCQREESTVLLTPSPEAIENDRIALASKRFDDSLKVDSPKFDDSSVERQFPLSLTNPPKGPRLAQTKQNGSPLNEYRYDTQGRLTEIVSRFVKSDVVCSRRVYQYTDSNLRKIDFYSSNEPPIVAAYDRTHTFISNEVGRVSGYYEDRNNNGGHIQDLRFDQAGRLIWLAPATKDFYNTYVLMGYTSAIRDVKGNVRILKKRNRTDEKLNQTIEYDYDEKPNPFYTIGDEGFLSTNNVVKETTRDYTGKVINIVDYQYEYRSDGFPISRTSGSNVVEFIYQ
ncbi:hypothetical protein [Spirosoma harenae]